jgi:hypothetical protein
MDRQELFKNISQELYSYNIFDLMTLSCISGDVNTIKNLVESNYPYENYDDDIIVLACETNQLDVLKYLVNDSGLPDEFFDKGNQPFYCAFLYGGSLELKKFMCQSKKLVDSFHKCNSKYDYTNIFIYACKFSGENLELIKYFVENDIFPIEYCMAIDFKPYIDENNIECISKSNAFTECTGYTGVDIEKNEVLNYLLNSNKFPDSFFKIDETYFWKNIQNPNFENDFAFVKKHPRFKGTF